MPRLLKPKTPASAAEELDRQLRAQWAEMKIALSSLRKSSIKFGKLCAEMRERGLHRFVRRQGSRKFVSFSDYVHDLTGGEISRSTLYASIDLYELTRGPNPVGEDDVAAMPVQNACLLRKLRPEQRTREVIEAAKTTSKREFPARLQATLNESLPTDQHRALRVDYYRKLDPSVANRLDETIERFTQLPVVRDGDRTLTLDEKAIYTMCNAAEQFASDDFAVVENEERTSSGSRTNTLEREKGTPGLLK